MSFPQLRGMRVSLGFLDDSEKCHYLINTSFPRASWQGGWRTDTFHHPLSTLHFGARLNSSTESHSNRNTSILIFLKMSLMCHVHKREAVFKISPFSFAYIWVLPLLLLTHLYFELYMQSKCKVLIFSSLWKHQPHACILDYTLYNHEKGKCNPLERNRWRWIFCLVVSCPSSCLTNYSTLINSSKGNSPHFTVLTNLKTETQRVRKEINFPQIHCMKDLQFRSLSSLYFYTYSAQQHFYHWHSETAGLSKRNGPSI